MHTLDASKATGLEDVQWLNDVFAGGNVKRHHNYPILDRQSVAEHTWRMIVIYDRLWPNELTIETLRKILYHDVSEYKTGDVPANTKWRSPELANELARLQREDDDRLGISIQVSDEEFNRVKFCDRLELMIFALEQRRLGNRNVTRPFYAVTKAIQDHPILGEDRPASLFTRIVREFRSQESNPSHVGGYRDE
jgi:5'-deoxynucleotidase YfbR-like HD superfamily hydrolase